MTPVWWLLAFIPALIALYFLKLRRTDVVVPSTMLWQRALEDLHVNAPFQRLRKSWLLLLQLLILAALILSVWRPRIAGQQEVGRSLILLFDVSASMSARESGGTRLELAREEALKLVEAMGETDRIALLTFASRTNVAEQLTGDRHRLTSRIRQIEGDATPSRIEQALLVAASIAEALPLAEILVLGDGCYGDLSALPPELKRLKVRFRSVASALDNVGITEVDVRQTFDTGARTEAFALVENLGAAARSVVCSLYLGDALKDARELELPAGATLPVVFDISGAEPGIARMAIDVQDALPLDNQVWVRVLPRKDHRVLVVGKPNPWIDLVLKASRGLTARRWSEEEYRKAILEASSEDLPGRLDADVLLLDRVRLAPASSASPEQSRLLALEPPLPALYFGSLPETPARFKAGEPRKLPVVVDWDRSHPVNRFLVYADLYIEEGTALQPTGEYVSLVDADAGSIIGALRFYPPGSRPLPAVVVGFDLLKTNWPIGHYSFPIFIANAVEWLGSGAGQSRQSRVRTGEPIVLDLGAAVAPRDAAAARFRTPSGKEAPAGVESAAVLVLSSADEVGVHRNRGSRPPRRSTSATSRCPSRALPKARGASSGSGSPSPHSWRCSSSGTPITGA
jgi:hypothetical protein